MKAKKTCLTVVNDLHCLRDVSACHERQHYGQVSNYKFIISQGGSSHFLQKASPASVKTSGVYPTLIPRFAAAVISMCSYVPVNGSSEERIVTPHHSLRTWLIPLVNLVQLQRGARRQTVQLSFRGSEHACIQYLGIYLSHRPGQYV